MDNIKIISDYIKSGIKTNGNDRIGIELEHFVTVKGGYENVPYSGENGVGALLEKISHRYENKTYSEGYLVGLYNDEYSITIEPAAQLEISIAPVEKLETAEKIYADFRNIVDPVLEEMGLNLVTEGYRREGKAAEQELIPKKRYEFMNRYFEKTGRYGKNMMRSTASTQVSIDYTSERDCVLKFRTANILSPLLSLICDNSGYFEGVPYSGRMARTAVWSSVDNDRCGIVPYIFDEDFGFDKYAKYIYERPAILVINDGIPEYTGNKKISGIYKNKQLTEPETEHILSMFFPDVRLKKYIEIRPADSLPLDAALSYAALVKGVFKKAEDFDIKPITVHDIENAKSALMKDGFFADVYGTKAYKLCEKMLDTAKNTLDAEDAKYLPPIERVISERKSFKEERK